MMRFLKWYWRLTKKTFARNPDVTFSDFFRSYIMISGWAFVTFPLIVLTYVFFAWLWALLPDFIRDSVMSAAGSVWASLRPVFYWFSSIDFVSIGRSIDNFFHLFLRLSLHLVVGIITTSFVFVFLLFMLDLLRIRVFKYDLEREKRTAIVFLLVMALFAGYSATVSERSTSIINRFVAWELNH